MDGTSITYSGRSCEDRKKAAVSRSRHQVKKFGSDPDAMHGPLTVKVTSKVNNHKEIHNQLIYNYCVLYKQLRIQYIAHGDSFQVSFIFSIMKKTLYVSSGVIATLSALCELA